MNRNLSSVRLRSSRNDRDQLESWLPDEDT